MGSSDDVVPCEDFETCGVAQFQNKQYWKNVKQQDSYFVVEDLGATFGVPIERSQRVALYGVADGHGEFGEISANFIRRNFPPQLAKSPHFAAGQLHEALLDAFSQTEFLQQAAGLPLWASGACVLAAAVSPTQIVVANCGDCRCVLADQGTAQDLSQDHNVERATPQELRRILECGGTIMPDKRVTVPGAPGRLAATRSLGDYWAKQQGPSERHVVSGLPELMSVARTPSQQHLILASDGVFGFMSSPDVVGLCASAAAQLVPRAPLSRISHTVVSTAVNARHSDDNCTCLVVDLHRLQGSFAAVPAHVVPSPHPSGQLEFAASTAAAASRRGGAASPSMHSAGTTLPPPMLQTRHHGLPLEEGHRDESDVVSLSSLVAPDEVCWCPWCWGMNSHGEPESVVLGSFERWRLHMHEQHFDKLGGAYGPEELVPCYWCCRPCATKEGQRKTFNRLPFWGSHERVCRDNPNKPGLPVQGQGPGPGHSLSSAGSLQALEEARQAGARRQWQLRASGHSSGTAAAAAAAAGLGSAPYPSQDDRQSAATSVASEARSRSHVDALAPQPARRRRPL